MLLIRRHVIERVMVCVSNDYASMRDIYKETHSMGIGVHIFFFTICLVRMVRNWASSYGGCFVEHCLCGTRRINR